MPQWFPQSWDVTVTGNGKTISLESAQPDYGAAGTSAGGLDLDAVYVGLGSEADFAGRDVKGKAVVRVQHAGRAERECGATRRCQGRGGDPRSEHASGQCPLSGVSVRNESAGIHGRPRRRRRRSGHHGGDASRAVRSREREARRPASAESEDGADLGDAAGRDRRDDLHHRASRRLVRRVGRQRQRRRVDARSGRTLREDSSGAAEADDDLHRAGRPSQLRRRVGGGEQVARRQSTEALRQDRAGDQRRASLHRSDAVASAVLQRQRNRLGQHLHAAAVVRGRPVAARAPEDRGRARSSNSA